ncbi:hypothetical protein [Yersinia ruckeri]|uniref:Phage replication protein n=1 Tax=Yersinia ruckeri TaxID=29486 RepID=A0A0A8VIT0_YERRU|nr:hypothetical protein [Yersinia ruckeri]MCK8594297.1 hypothetical protein [Yersinia ruckeri]MCK8596751.1 hypothetical protein [Yersinia ruckeri]MCW6525179.1 hypothetical protein [Yersinia ruckeri]MCW6603055.1 hypothetical protein [Yersinia ruckeri]MCW6609675.1 hypothetical protein [Yersinia ruckeri]
MTTKIRDFADSIGLSISEQQAQSLACGATLTIGGQNWRARGDCCLYQCQPTTAQRVFSVMSRVAKLREGVNRESHQY